MKDATMLIAEDLLLLLTDDRSGKLLASASELDIALGGALLVELALAGRVAVESGRLHVTDPSGTGDALLDEAVSELADHDGKKPRDVVGRLGKGLRRRLYARLAEQGLLHEETRRILELVPVHRWPADDNRHEETLRIALAEALRTGGAPEPRLAALVALLHALKRVAKVVDPADVGLTKQELDANAKRIAEGDWAAKAVRDAIAAMLAAVIAATTAASVAGSAGN
jgi:hypothetical protein